MYAAALDRPITGRPFKHRRMRDIEIEMTHAIAEKLLNRRIVNAAISVLEAIRLQASDR
jgi:hypothetical protein